ncbi:MAG: MFS transporter [Actinobacteria bacterium]|nr:MFS transporter [Actinomycetota bacterium]
MRKPRPVPVLAIIAFLVALGFGIVSPVLPVFARTFGVTTLAAGAVASSFALVRVASLPMAAKLARALAERRVIVAGVLIVAVSSAACAAATSYWAFLLARAAGGIGSAMFTIGATTLLFSVTPSERLGRASGLFNGGFVLGGMTGPVLGGILTGASLRAPFVVYAIGLGVAGLVAWTMLPIHGETTTAVLGSVEAPAAEVPLRVAFRDRRYLAAVLSAFGQGWQSNGVRSLVVPLVVVETLGKPASWSAWAFGAAAAAQALTLYGSGWVTDRVGRRVSLVVGSVATGLLGLAFVAPGSYTSLVVVLCLYGVGASLASTSTQASVGDAIGRRGGPALAGYQMAGDIGQIAGPLAAGALLDAGSTPAAVGIGAVFLFLAAAGALTMPRTLRPAQA